RALSLPEPTTSAAGSWGTGAVLEKLVCKLWSGHVCMFGEHDFTGGEDDPRARPLPAEASILVLIVVLISLCLRQTRRVPRDGAAKEALLGRGGRGVRGGGRGGITIFSGGTAGNALVPVIDRLTANATYVLGVSDNGGSTSEILRVLGGPAIGDIRSRLTRLVPLSPASPPAPPPQNLPTPPADECDAEAVTADHANGTGDLHLDINRLAGFLLLLHNEVLKRAHKRFDFRNASVGNFFLTGARIFFGSLESAIFQFAAMTGIQESVQVVPVINTNHTVNIAAKLTNGDVILGQCQISHPSKPVHQPKESKASRLAIRDSLGQRKITIQSHIICSFRRNTTLIYSIGSLYTSIHPCLILWGMGKAIAESPSLRHKILLLNSQNDRETPEYTAVDFLRSVAGALDFSLGNAGWPREHPVASYVTHLVYLDNGEIPVDIWQIEKLGVHCVSVRGAIAPNGNPVYVEEELYRVLRSIIFGV
ncbi:MAG: hypothetical protein BJ554DRAFT_7435, partial [Olpidium bornovanus]